MTESCRLKDLAPVLPFAAPRRPSHAPTNHGDWLQQGTCRCQPQAARNPRVRGLAHTLVRPTPSSRYLRLRRMIGRMGEALFHWRVATMVKPAFSYIDWTPWKAFAGLMRPRVAATGYASSMVAPWSLA